MGLMLSAGPVATNRLATTLTALYAFLDDPGCRSCEVLEICLQHLQDDASIRRSGVPKDLLRKLRQSVPFAASHRRCEGRRCPPAEQLMRYLTP